MRLRARRPWWSGAVAGLALALAVPATAAASAPTEHRAGAPATAAAKKRKPVTCTAAQLRLTIKSRVRCVTAPRRAALGDPHLTLLRDVVRRDLPGVRTRGGRRAPAFWKGAGGRLKAVRARLLRALPKALALSRRGVGARAAARGDRTACRDVDAANLPDQRGSFDGFSVSTNARGDVSMNVSAQGYAIDVIIGGNSNCSDIDLPECPRPDGLLEGTDRHQSVIGLRVTKDGALVQSFRTTVRSTQKLRGEVAADAKLDRVSLEDTANETTTVALPGATVTLRVSVLRTATLQMRSGATTGAQVRVGFSLSGGFTVADGIAAAGRAATAYAQSFPELISEERGNFQRRESAWQSPGACAKLVFAPPTDTIKVPRSVAGTVQPRIEANAGGTATKAKWTLSAQEKGTFSTPPEVPSPSITYTPTGQDREKLKAKFRATSTAGVAEGEWAQEIEDRIRYFKVTGLEYGDQLAFDGLPTVGSCNPSTSQTNSTTLTPSGLPYDGALGTLGLPGGGPLQGSIQAVGSVLSTVSWHGCQITPEGDDYMACNVMSAGSHPTPFLIDVELPATGTATVTWHPLPVQVGQVPPVIGQCIGFGGQSGVVPDPVKTSVPLDTFTSAGPHTVSVDAPANVPAIGGGGTLHSTARYAFTFTRVNADGSPYAG